uniref:Ig-like domain-containing protein n=1 Tax=Callorhinchus milii TaxID=7868 RepID=A0A4W3IYQ2_CALMI
EIEEHERPAQEEFDELIHYIQQKIQNVEPVELIKDIEDQTVRTKVDALFECIIKINYPEIKLSWYKGTEKLESNDKYEITIDGDIHRLKVKSCEFHDQSNIRLVCGPHISSAKLTVVEPIVEQHLEHLSGKEGQICIMVCQFSLPNLKTEWFKNGRQIEGRGRYSIHVSDKTQKLTISDVKPEDQGRFTCKFENLETSADLRVEGL